MIFYGPIATLYRQSQGVSVLEITIIESISLVLCLLLEIPWGIVADKIGYKRSMVLCCVLYAISKIVFWQATSFSGFLLERIMLSFVIAGLSGVDSSILYLSCKEEQSQKVFGIYNSLQTTGLLIAALVFSAVIGSNYKLAGFLTFISYGIAAVLSLGLKEVKTENAPSLQPKNFISILRQTLKDKYLLLFLLAVAFLSETHQTITVFLNQLQYIKCGLSSSAIGYIFIAVTVAGLSGVFSSRISEKLGVGKTATIIFIFAILASVVLAFTGSAWLSVAGILILRISYSLFQPLQTQLQNKQVVTTNRATALSINAIIIDSVGIGSNIVFGALAERSLSYAMLFGAGLCLLGVIMFAVWRRNKELA